LKFTVVVLVGLKKTFVNLPSSFDFLRTPDVPTTRFFVEYSIYSRIHNQLLNRIEEFWKRVYILGKRVYILGMNKYMPSRYAKKDWQMQQEHNLMYVAVTRSMGELVYIDVQ
jgi:hypothetical protein